MSDQTKLLRDIHAYCRKLGIAPTTFGSLALKDSRFVERVRAGTVQVNTMQKARDYMRENPPRGKAA